jgi:hypothetical protein
MLRLLHQECHSRALTCRLLSLQYAKKLDGNRQKKARQKKRGWIPDQAAWQVQVSLLKLSSVSV